MKICNNNTMQSFIAILDVLVLVFGIERVKANWSEDIVDWTEKKTVWRWNVEEYPHPQTHPEICNRFSPSYVCDPDDILTTQQADDLDSNIRQVSNDVLCACPECPEPYGGFIIGIALLKYIYHPNEHPSNVIQKFAADLRGRWKLGACENDILILVVTKDRLSYTDVGPGIKPFISIEKARGIFIENKAYFTVGNYSEGLKSMVKNYHALSRLIKVRKDDSVKNTGLTIGLAVGLTILLVVILLFALIIYKRRKSRSSDRKSSISEDVSSSWKRKDTTWMTLSSEYKPCKTEDDGTDYSERENGDPAETKLPEKNEDALQTALEAISEEGKEFERGKTEKRTLHDRTSEVHEVTLESSENNKIHFTDV